MPTPPPLSHLGDISIETFIAEYWHKKPLLIRQAFPDFEAPVTPDELAGLACESEVESRLLIENPDSGDWQLKHGPFEESLFSELPKEHWTLLVQGVDHWVPEAADFIEQFRFIPSWRLDDLMISYAAKGGGVGPHYDNYDVFLLQVGGQRRWEVGGLHDQDSEFLPGKPVRILSHWEPEQSWVLNPGDMLYLPPRVGHNGVAVSDDCVTYSVGYRAPQNGDMLLHFANFCGWQLKDSDRYADPDLSLRNSSGEICNSDLQRVQSMFREFVEDRENLARWFGRFVTEPKFPENQQEGANVDFDDCIEDHIEALKTQPEGVLRRGEGIRFAYSQSGGVLQLFVQGHSFNCPLAMRPLVELLCDQNEVPVNQIQPWIDDPDGAAVLEKLLFSEYLYIL